MSVSISLHIAVDTGGESLHGVCLYEGNVTYNLGPMWMKAGCRDEIYDSNEKTAKEILPALQRGLEHMKANRSEYLPLNPSNGWGNYDGAVEFLTELTNACQRHPKSTVSVFR